MAMDLYLPIIFPSSSLLRGGGYLPLIFPSTSLWTWLAEKGTEPDSRALGGPESLTPSRSALGRPQAARHEQGTAGRAEENSVMGSTRRVCQATAPSGARELARSGPNRVPTERQGSNREPEAKPTAPRATNRRPSLEDIAAGNHPGSGHRKNKSEGVPGDWNRHPFKRIKR